MKFQDYADRFLTVEQATPKASWYSGAKASFAEGWEWTGASSIARTAELYQAGHGGYVPDISSEMVSPEDIPHVATEAQRRSTLPRVSNEAAKAMAKEAGVQVDFGDASYTKEAAQIMVDRALERKRRAEIIQSSEISTVSQIALGLGAGLLDPVNLIAAFLPIAPASMVNRITQATTVFGRTGARVAVGSLEGAGGAALVEPISAFAATQEGRDYGVSHFLTNVAFGAGVGAVLRPVAGGLKDVWDARLNASLPDPTNIAARLDADTYQAALQAEIAHLVDETDIRASEVIDRKASTEIKAPAVKSRGIEVRFEENLEVEEFVKRKGYADAKIIIDGEHKANMQYKVDGDTMTVQMIAAQKPAPKEVRKAGAAMTNALGPRDIRAVVDYVRQTYPEVTTIKGIRASGGRQAAGGKDFKGEDAEVKIRDNTPGRGPEPEAPRVEQRTYTFKDIADAINTAIAVNDGTKAGGGKASNGWTTFETLLADYLPGLSRNKLQPFLERLMKERNLVVQSGKIKRGKLNAKERAEKADKQFRHRLSVIRHKIAERFPNIARNNTFYLDQLFQHFDDVQIGEKPFIRHVNELVEKGEAKVIFEDAPDATKKNRLGPQHFDDYDKRSSTLIQFASDPDPLPPRQPEMSVTVDLPEARPTAIKEPESLTRRVKLSAAIKRDGPDIQDFAARQGWWIERLKARSLRRKKTDAEKAEDEHTTYMFEQAGVKPRTNHTIAARKIAEHEREVVAAERVTADLESEEEFLNQLIGGELRESDLSPEALGELRADRAAINEQLTAEVRDIDAMTSCIIGE